jgi:menaquinone-dependent protoporphyrinogen IX oxidase
MNNILASILIVYFSATGTTANVAQNMAQAVDAPIYEIKAKVPYSMDDLNWHNEKSRSSLEMANAIAYPELADLNAPVKDYDVIYLGFPIWWGSSPKIVNQFVKNYDLSGKKIILFATSSSSDLGNTAEDLKKDALGNPQIITGKVFHGNPSSTELLNFVNEFQNKN